MTDTTDVTTDSSTVTDPAPAATQEEIVVADVKKPEDSAPKPEEKVVPYDRFKQVNDELQALKKQPVKTVNKALDVEDYIDISASLDGLDQREKSYLAEQHKLTGKALSDIRSSEDFGFWQSAYKQKVEKEKALKPTGTQSESENPKSLEEQLATASMADKEKLLASVGLYKTPNQKTDRVNIGSQR